MQVSIGFKYLVALGLLVLLSVFFVNNVRQPSPVADYPVLPPPSFTIHSPSSLKNVSAPRPQVGVGRRGGEYNHPIQAPPPDLQDALQNLKTLIDEDVKTLAEDPATGGFVPDPTQIAIVTTWRSGSTFTEAFLDSHPAMYDIYEPLSQFDLNRARTDSRAIVAASLIRDLLQCKYDSAEYMKTLIKINQMVDPLLQQVCKKIALPRSNVCHDPNFLSQACKLFPWMLLKIVRLKLALMQPLLETPVSSNLHIIYLVRDPRAVINSRRSTVEWCKPKDQDCYSPAVLCTDMDEDLESFKILKKLYPNRVHLLRYEDFMNDVVSTAQNVTQWVGLNFTSSMRKFVEDHTNKEIDKPWTISRKSKEHLLHWTHSLSLDGLHEIQDSCAQTMMKFGYKIVNTLENLTAEDVFQDVMFYS